MNWIELNSIDQLDFIKNSESPSVIFKHSTRCSVSNMVLKMFQKEWDANSAIPVYYLDLIQHRNISKMIAEDFQVHHESPQVLLINKNECLFDASHNEISAEEVIANLQ